MKRSASILAYVFATLDSAIAWETIQERDALSNQPLVVTSVSATAPFEDRYGRQRMPTLHIRCKEGWTSLFIHMDGMFLSDHGQHGLVRYRIGNGRPDAYPFSATTNNEALILSSWPAVAMIKALFGHDQWVVQVLPNGESPETVTFPIRGIEQAVKPVRQACRW
jgi:type VI secretion system protein VasI